MLLRVPDPGEYAKGLLSTCNLASRCARVKSCRTEMTGDLLLHQASALKAPKQFDVSLGSAYASVCQPMHDQQATSKSRLYIVFHAWRGITLT